MMGCDDRSIITGLELAASLAGGKRKDMERCSSWGSSNHSRGRDSHAHTHAHAQTHACVDGADGVPVYSKPRPEPIQVQHTHAHADTHAHAHARTHAPEHTTAHAHGHIHTSHTPVQQPSRPHHRRTASVLGYVSGPEHKSQHAAGAHAHTHARACPQAHSYVHQHPPYLQPPLDQLGLYLDDDEFLDDNALLTPIPTNAHAYTHAHIHAHGQTQADGVGGADWEDGFEELKRLDDLLKPYDAFVDSLMLPRQPPPPYPPAPAHTLPHAHQHAQPPASKPTTLQGVDDPYPSHPPPPLPPQLAPTHPPPHPSHPHPTPRHDHYPHHRHDDDMLRDGAPNVSPLTSPTCSEASAQSFDRWVDQGFTDWGFKDAHDKPQVHDRKRQRREDPEVMVLNGDTHMVVGACACGEVEGAPHTHAQECVYVSQQHTHTGVMWGGHVCGATGCVGGVDPLEITHSPQVTHTVSHAHPPLSQHAGTQALTGAHAYTHVQPASVGTYGTHIHTHSPGTFASTAHAHAHVHSDTYAFAHKEAHAHTHTAVLELARVRALQHQTSGSTTNAVADGYVRSPVFPDTVVGVLPSGAIKTHASRMQELCENGYSLSPQFPSTTANVMMLVATHAHTHPHAQGHSGVCGGYVEGGYDVSCRQAPMHEGLGVTHAQTHTQPCAGGGGMEWMSPLQLAHALPLPYAPAYMHTHTDQQHAHAHAHGSQESGFVHGRRTDAAMYVSSGGAGGGGGVGGISHTHDPFLHTRTHATHPTHMPVMMLPPRALDDFNKSNAVGRIHPPAG